MLKDSYLQEKKRELSKNAFHIHEKQFLYIDVMALFRSISWIT